MTCRGHSRQAGRKASSHDQNALCRRDVTMWVDHLEEVTSWYLRYQSTSSDIAVDHTASHAGRSHVGDLLRQTAPEELQARLNTHLSAPSQAWKSADERLLRRSAAPSASSGRGMPRLRPALVASARPKARSISHRFVEHVGGVRLGVDIPSLSWECQQGRGHRRGGVFPRRSRRIHATAHEEPPSPL